MRFSVGGAVVHGSAFLVFAEFFDAFVNALADSRLAVEECVDGVCRRGSH